MFGVVGGFGAGVEAVEALFTFTPCSRIFPMHIETVGTAIDLRGAQLDQLEQRWLKTALAHSFFQSGHCTVGSWSNLAIVNAFCHGSCSPLFSLHYFIQKRILGHAANYRGWPPPEIFR